MKLKVGDRVKLNKNVKKFEYGSVGIGYDEISRVVRIDEYNDIFIDFPSLCGWCGLEHELVLVNRTKFFKNLPNNFTGTIEVENGYIVEKEILDEEEKEYLSNVIKPFRDEVESIVKRTFNEKEYIKIIIKNDCDLYFPSFEEGSMYIGMEVERKYTLEELGL